MRIQLKCNSSEPCPQLPCPSSFGRLQKIPHFPAQTAPGAPGAELALAGLGCPGSQQRLLLSQLQPLVCPGAGLSISLSPWEHEVLPSCTQRIFDQMFGDPAGDLGSEQLLALPSQAAAAQRGSLRGSPVPELGRA